MDTIGEPFTTITILMHQDSLATVERQRDTPERLITLYRAKAFWGEQDTDPKRHTA